MARYWPEFEARDVLVRQVLGHTSGLSGWNEPLAPQDLYHPTRAAALLARQEPWWTPGDGSGYHAITFGTLAGELVRRVTHASLGMVLRKDFAGPADADFWLGTPACVAPRIATLVPPPSGLDLSALDANGVAMRTLTNPVIAPTAMKDPDFLAAELGAFNGQGNARSVARLQAIVSHGGTFEGRRYLSRTGVERTFSQQCDGVDRVLLASVRFGLGYALPGSPILPALPPEGRICWWTGLGGSVVVNDLDRRLTFAYVKNGMEGGLAGAPNAREYTEALYSCVDG